MMYDHVCSINQLSKGFLKHMFVFRHPHQAPLLTPTQRFQPIPTDLVQARTMALLFLFVSRESTQPRGYCSPVRRRVGCVNE
jgi:hypothetical protein